MVWFCPKCCLQFSDMWLESLKLMENDAMSHENSVGQGGGGKTEPTLCHFHGIGSMLECRPGKTSFCRPCCYSRTCRSPAQADYDC